LFDLLYHKQKPNLSRLKNFSQFFADVLIHVRKAWPIAYVVMKNWLSNFAYRIDVEVRVFILSGILACVIALLTVSYQSIKTAVMSPADSMRGEEDKIKQ